MFQNISLQEVCNVIILVSAVLIAAKNIYGFLKKPVKDLHEHAQAEEEHHIQEVVNKQVPDIVKKNQESIISTLDEIKEILANQDDDLSRIQESVDVLNVSQMDLMRYNINRLYYKYRPYKKILDCDKKAFIKLYDDYHSMGGNTWIDSLYKEVIQWEIVEYEDELKS